MSLLTQCRQTAYWLIAPRCRLLRVASDIACNVVFTLEILLRMFGTNNMPEYFHDVLNVVDLVREPADREIPGF